MTALGRSLKFLAASLPIVLWLCFLIVIQIPRGFELMSDTPAPWYQGITTALFIVCAFFFYPVTYLFQLFGSLELLLKFSYFAWSLAYSFLLSGIIFLTAKHIGGK